MQRIKSLLIILFLFGLFTFGCSKEKNEEVRPLCCVMPPCSDKLSLNGTWRLAGYRNLSTGVLETDPDPDGKEVVFTFEDNGKEGNIEGHTFANTIFGKYTLGSGCKITIKEFSGTKVSEPEWSGRAWLASDSTGNYQRIKNVLMIYRNKGNNVWEGMEFRKE